jgi:hypothetical protein
VCFAAYSRVPNGCITMRWKMCGPVDLSAESIRFAHDRAAPAAAVLSLAVVRRRCRWICASDSGAFLRLRTAA